VNSYVWSDNASDPGNCSKAYEKHQLLERVHAT